MNIRSSNEPQALASGASYLALQLRSPAASAVGSFLSRRRNGSILICVMVCVLVASTLVATTLHFALRSRSEVRTQRYLRQTELLLEAGVQRAAQRLAANEEYAGETVTLSPESIPGCTLAQLEIKVPSLDDGEWPRNVEVVARLAHDGHYVIQRSYKYPVNDLAESDQE